MLLRVATARQTTSLERWSRKVSLLTKKTLREQRNAHIIARVTRKGTAALVMRVYAGWKGLRADAKRKQQQAERVIRWLGLSQVRVLSSTANPIAL